MKLSCASVGPSLRVLALVSAVWCASASALAADAPREPHLFDVLEYRVEGNSLLDDQAIERAVMPHMGPGQTLDTVERARQALERQYRDAGYLTVLVTIPEQNVMSGVVALQVTEAPVSRLRVVGAQYNLPSQIKAGVPEVAEGRVPNFHQLQKQLSGVNSRADLRVAPVLKPGKAPGSVEVQLEVDDQLPLHGSVEVNNRQSLNTTQTRLSASLRYDNLWQRGHSASLSLQLSPQDLRETRVLVANYMVPVGREGDAVSVYGVVSRSRFASIFNSPGLSVLGNNDVLGVRYALALEGSDRYAHSMSFGFDHKRVLQSVGLDGSFDDSPAIRYTPLAANYRGTWLNQGVPQSILDVTAITGLRRFLGDDDEAFDARRAGASSSFMALRTGLQWMRDWGRWPFVARLDAQLASGPLLSSEQYSAGGADTVRGYFEGERAGDQALRVSLELATPTYRIDPQAGLWRVSGLVFADSAVLHVIDAGLGESSRYRLGSFGTGLRLSGPRGMSLSFDLARALSDGDVAGGGTREGDWRAHLRWVMEF